MTHMTKRGMIAAALWLLFGSVHAAVFDVTNPGEFQSALTTAQANGEDDIINVAECSGSGCAVISGQSVYDINTTLSYTASASEGRSLSIDGFDSDTRVLDGGMAVSILRIDTRPATDDFGAQIVVNGLTFAQGNAVGSPNDGGALAIYTNDAQVEVLGSVFAANEADDDGGALFVRAEGVNEAPIRIDDVTFDSNSARGVTPDEGNGDGGSAYISASAGVNVEVYDVEFFDSTADGKGGCLVIEGLDPGDTFGRSITAANLYDVAFDGCVADFDGGGAFIAASTVEIDRTGIVRSTASSGSGGGLYVEEGWSIFFMKNTGFAGNRATIDGGGLFIAPSTLGADGSATLVNNTLVQNEASGAGGNVSIAVGGSTGLLRVYNTILYEGVAGSDGDDIYINNDPFGDIPASVEFQFNDIGEIPTAPTFNNDSFFIASSADLTASDNISDAPLLEGVLDADPNPRQLSTSPTIDAGNNDVFARPFVDFEDTPRPQDGDGDMTATTDIGMDEFVAGAAPSADLVAALTDSPDPVTEQQDVTYAITIDNDGPDAASGVTLTLQLDAGVSLVTASPSQGSACTSSGTPLQVSCALGDIASGADANITVEVTAPEVSAATTISATASVSGNEADPNSADNSATTTTTVVPAGPAQADLAVTKNASPDPIASRGPELTYVVTVQNNGPDVATGVTLTDTLPIDDVTFVSATPSNGGSCSVPGTDGEIVCNLGELAVESNASVDFVVIPNAVITAATISNTASVTGNEEDPVASNNTAVATTTVGPPEVDLSVLIAASTDEPSINEAVTFTVSVTSSGPSDSEGVVLTLTVPEAITLQSINIDAGSCDVDGTEISCPVGDLAANAAVTATLDVTAPATEQLLTLAAAVTSDTSDTNSSNNSDSFTVNVIEAVELVVKGRGGSSSAFGWLELLLGAAALAALRIRGRLPHAVLTAIPMVLIFALPMSKAYAEDWYIGGAVGQATADYSSSDLSSDLASRGWSITDVDVDDTDDAWRIYAGFHFNDYFAAELGYVDLGEVTARFGVAAPPNEFTQLLRDTREELAYLGKGWTAGGAVRLPLGGDRLLVTARAGFLDWEADVRAWIASGGSGRVSGSESGTDLYLGVGAEWLMTPQLSLTLDWNRYRMDEWVDAPMLGLRVRF